MNSNHIQAWLINSSLVALGDEDDLAVAVSGVRVGEDRDEGGDVVLAVDLAPVPPGVEVRLVLVLDPPVVLLVVVDLAAVR